MSKERIILSGRVYKSNSGRFELLKNNVQQELYWLGVNLYRGGLKEYLGKEIEIVLRERGE